MNKPNPTQPLCVYCASPEPETRDHIPPKAIFTKPRPNDLLTVPCCQKCNSQFGRDDDYFAIALSQCERVYSSWRGKALWKKTLRALRRPQKAKLLKNITSDLRDLHITTPSGIYLGNKPTIAIDAERFDRVNERIVRAIIWRETKIVPILYGIDILYPMFVDNVVFNNRELKKAIYLITSEPMKGTSCRTFSYWFRSTDDNTFAFGVLLRFFEVFECVAFCTPVLDPRTQSTPRAE